MKYVSQGPLMVDVHMHKPQTNAKNFMDALLAFWPGLQVCCLFFWMLTVCSFACWIYTWPNDKHHVCRVLHHSCSLCRCIHLHFLACWLSKLCLDRFLRISRVISSCELMHSIWEIMFCDVCRCWKVTWSRQLRCMKCCFRLFNGTIFYLRSASVYQ